MIQSIIDMMADDVEDLQKQGVTFDAAVNQVIDEYISNLDNLAELAKIFCTNNEFESLVMNHYSEIYQAIDNKFM